MPIQSAAVDISLFWIAGQEPLDRKSLAMPEATACSSLADALDKATAPASEGAARAWLQADGILFSPAQVDVLRRITASPA